MYAYPLSGSVEMATPGDKRTRFYGEKVVADSRQRLSEIRGNGGTLFRCGSESVIHELLFLIYDKERIREQKILSCDPYRRERRKDCLIFESGIISGANRIRARDKGKEQQNGVEKSRTRSASCTCKK